MRKHVLVTGSMRSGTTYVGKVLAQSPALSYLHEPFNCTWGIRGVEHWFPYAHAPGDLYARLVDDFFALDFTYKHVPADSFAKNIFKKLIGGRASWQATRYKAIGRFHSRLLIKDPLAAFLSRYMYEQHGAAVVVLVRHPVSFYYSNKRLGWGFDFENLLAQEALIENHLRAEVPLMERRTLSYVQQIALLWRCVYKVLADFTQKHQAADGWMVKRHEDVCLQPHRVFEDVYQTLGLDLRPEVLRFIDETTSSANAVEAPGNAVHALGRDSKQLAFYGRNQASSADVRAIREVTAEVAQHYYEDNTWEVN